MSDRPDQPNDAAQPPGATSRTTEAQRAIVEHAGRAALADELYDLRCELALADFGEKAYTPAQRAAMRERVALLEPIVGKQLDAELAAEDEH